MAARTFIRTAPGKTGELIQDKMWQQDAYVMIQHRAADARIKTKIGNHTFRATSIANLKNKGTLEAAQHIANYDSSRTTKLYNRRVMRFQSTMSKILI
ncbi:MAG: hypothetical protein JO189_29380 [Deltaproteobacteria bacterium]|nr:hypothetical protein [Deltaproteobacteria bacterium]